VKDTAACAITGERGMIVAIGHDLCVCFCVCGETTKNKEESKIVNVSKSILHWISNLCYFGNAK
jgi:hypothetical protein